MATYILRRLLLVPPTLIGITIVVFLVMALAPGGISAAYMSREGTIKPEERRAMEAYLNKRYGLDKPLYQQYLRWLNKVSPLGVKEADEGFPKSMAVGFKVPDLGESVLRRRRVSALLAEALPITILLNLIAFPIIYATSIYAGIRAANSRGSAFDVASGTIFLALWSIPTTLVAVAGIGFLANEQYVHWFPANGLHDLLASEMSYLPSFGPGGFERGYLLDMIWHLVLPVICLVYADFAILSKLSRGAVLENVVADYARTARAKGVSAHDVLYHHVVRNSLFPLITVASSIIPGMLAGSVIVEVIFGINGMGRLMIQAVQQKDAELVLSEALIAGLVGLISQLGSDISYAIADPRVTYD